MTYREHETILSGEYSTDAYRIAASENTDGPTTVVIGGQHGNEYESWQAAWRITHWEISEGEIIIVPKSNRPACEAGQRNGPGGNLNRDWPSGRAPTSTPARELWEYMMSFDPDVCFDLHRSIGLYEHEYRGFDDPGSVPDKVGQAVFATPGEASRIAKEELCAEDGHLNTEHVERDTHNFRQGSDQAGGNSLLSRKWGADTDVAGFLVEVTSYQQPRQLRVDQLEDIVETGRYHAGAGGPAESYGHDGDVDGPVDLGDGRDGGQTQPDKERPEDIDEALAALDEIDADVDEVRSILQGYQ